MNFFNAHNHDGLHTHTFYLFNMEINGLKFYWGYGGMQFTLRRKNSLTTVHTDLADLIFVYVLRNRIVAYR